MKVFDLFPRLKDRRKPVSLRAADLKELHAIGVALASERNLQKLLERILEQGRKFLIADAGSLYLVDDSEKDEPTHLRFMLAQNDSVATQLAEHTIPINRESIAGYVALNRKPVVLDDVYKIPSGLPFRFNPEIDQRTRYRSRSVLAVPMTDHRDRLIGVVQLWNKKIARGDVLDAANVDRCVTSFTEEDYELLASLSAQAGVAIENARLYADIQALFHGFIKASIVAIESRDPTTSGHSERVAILTKALAVAAGGFNEEELRELEYAALLHDFGKIGVREDVLLKAKKLFPMELERITDRFVLLERTLELEFTRKKLDHLDHGGKRSDETWNQYEEELTRSITDLQASRNVLLQANEPTILLQKVADELIHLKKLDVITPDQYVRLTIPRGSLSEEERLEVESHVTHTYEFLRQIPWTRELRNVPIIAHDHHEKLDGSGYPRGKTADDIPRQSKLMTVADIFDALAARDRPYKKAVPIPIALDILRTEARQGKLDREVVDLFIDAKIYEKTADR